MSHWDCVQCSCRFLSALIQLSQVISKYVCAVSLFQNFIAEKKIGTTQNQLALVETNLKRSASLSCMVSLYNFFLHCVESEHLVTLHILNYCIKNICLISFQLIATKSSFILLLVLGICPLDRIWQCVHVTRQAVQTGD